MAADSERKLKRILEADGYYVQRGAGSQGVDLVAVNKRNGDTMLIEEKEFWGNTFSIRHTSKYLVQWKFMRKLQDEMNGHTGVFYALKKKGQQEYRFVRPTDLKKPYHWNQGESNGEVHRTQKVV